MFEFKHEDRRGRKTWTSHPGCEWILAVPTSCLVLDLASCWPSYPAFRVDGRLVRLNVSGGTDTIGGQHGWVDHIRWRADTSVNLPMSTIRALLGHAVDAGTLMRAGYAEVDEIGPHQWASPEEDTARMERNVAVALVGRHPMSWISAGMRLVLQPRVTYPDGSPIGSLTVVSCDGRHQRVQATDSGRPISVAFRHCDWAATASANGIRADLPASYDRLRAATPLAA